MEKVSFAGWRIKEGREDKWRHDVPSWYPHHLSSLESWFEREREREKSKKIRRREWNRFDRFRFRRARTTSFFVLPSPSLSLSAPSWPRFPTVAPLITPPLPPPPGRSPPAAPVFDSIRFRGVARGCPVASDAETWPSGKRWWPRRFWIGYSPSSLGKSWFRGLRGD